MAKQYLNVDYQDKDMAKRLGARWDANVKKWYVAPGSELSKILGWRAAKTQVVERAEFNLIAAMRAQNKPAPVPSRGEPAQLSLLG